MSHAGKSSNVIRVLEHLPRIMAGLVLISLIIACSAEDGAEGQPPAARQPESADEEVGDRLSSQLQVSSSVPTQSGPAAPSPPKQKLVTTGSPVNHNVHDLLEGLQSLAWDGGAASKEQADALLQSLRAKGVDALAPIRDFLLDEGASGAAAAALRQALLEVLLNLGMPEVEDAALELLASEPAAGEVWRLARYLEAIQPGKYADTILATAEQALIEADPATFVPAEFFQLLGDLGNAETALLLAETSKYHGAYASMALVSIPDGSGLPALAEHARVFQAGRDTVEGRLAIQLLAQQAPQFPEAAAVLLELAEQGVIPNDVWPYVLDIIAGNWQMTLEPPSNGLIGSHTYYRPEGNQTIFRAVPLQDADDGLQSQRLYLLDRLQPLAPPGLGMNQEG